MNKVTLKILIVLIVNFLAVNSYAVEPSMKVKELSQLEKEYSETPLNHEVNYEYCGSLVSNKKYNLALKVCTVAIETGNKNTLSWSYLNRGIAYNSLGMVEEAKKDRENSQKNGMPIKLLNHFLYCE